MSKGWLNLTLTSLGTLVGGGTPPRDRPDYFKGDIPWLTGQPLRDDRIVILESGSERISRRAIEDTATNLVPEGSVLVSTRVSIGKVAVAGVPLAFSQDVTALCFFDDLRPNIDSEYVAYAISTQRARLLQLNQGSTIVGITRESLGKLAIPLPPLSEQRRIVEILREAEAIRRHQAHAARTAAELIPALFQQMFGEIAPSRRRHPIAKLGKLLKFPPQNGHYQPAETYGSGTPIVRIGDFYDGIVNTGGLQRLRVSPDDLSTYGLAADDILVNRVNSMDYIGKSALVPNLREPTVFESNMMRLVVDQDRVLPRFLIQFLQTNEARAQLRRRAKHAVSQASINQEDVQAMDVMVPPIRDQARFIEAYAHIEAATANRDELTSELHASLLAHAFDGRLTDRWREQNAALLATEVAVRDATFVAKGIKPSIVGAAARPTDEDQAAIWTTPTDGAWADLTQRQRALWPFIPSLGAFGVADLLHARNKDRSLESLSEDGFRRELEVFVARGALVHVSRPKMNVEDEREVFQHYYRKVSLPDGGASWNAPAVTALAEQLRARLTSS